LATDIDTSTGKGLIAWETWAPTLSGGWLNGNGTWSATYAQLGKIVHVRALFTIGSTTTKGTTMNISIPVAASSVNSSPGLLNAGISASNFCLVAVPSGSVMNVQALTTTGNYASHANITATVPATWATGDTLKLSFTYQAS